LITKAVDSTVENWKGQVYVCRNEDELVDAYSKLKGERILLQQYIEKENETGFDALTVNGGEETYLPLQLSYYDITETSFGNSIYFFKPIDEKLCKKVRKLMAKTRYSGIFSIDFLIGKDGKIYFLEVNFRNSAWSYPSTCAGVNLPVIWAKSILSNKLVADDVNIKKLPYSAIADIDELSHALHQGLFKTLKVLIRIWNSNCCVIWNRKDQGPFWNIVRDFIKCKL
jgi:D-aspartate ligase